MVEPHNELFFQNPAQHIMTWAHNYQKGLVQNGHLRFYSNAEKKVEKLQFKSVMLNYKANIQIS